VKVWLDLDLVRAMDLAIVESAGGYEDRADFVAEAIRDRIAEDRQARPQPVVVPLRPQPSAPNPADTFGAWTQQEVPTADRTPGSPTNFGLHNRDLPTLWTLDQLGRHVTAAGGPVSWDAFVADVLTAAWEEGARLATADLRDAGSLKTSAGFPTNPRKRAATEARFLQHFLGVPGPRNTGPFFVFGLVGLIGDPPAAAVAPTCAAVSLMRELASIGGLGRPPFPPPAWVAFRSHLVENSPAELDQWLRVLGIVAHGPDRQALVERCDWWQGTQADTNAMSYVARAREWGLIEPKLIEGAYRLTPLGEQAVEEHPVGAAARLEESNR
jgi:hypothetical protein